MQKDEKLSLFRSFYNLEARVIGLDGENYGFAPEDVDQLNTLGNYWHHKEDPSSWLCEATVRLAKHKFKHQLNRSQVIELCASLLNISAAKLESSLNWNANYMAFKDGGSPDQNHVYPKSE